MSRGIKNILICITILFVLILVVLWLSKNCFFLDLENSDFNNLLTPLISLITVILLILTLSSSQDFNKKQLSLNEYNIFLQDFELIKTKLENLTFSVDVSGFSENFKTILSESNGINYLQLFSQFLNIELSDASNTKTNLIGKFRSGVIFPLIRNYRDLGLFLSEVINNDTLSTKYKKKFYLKVEQLLLQNYFRICNNIDSSDNLVYDLKITDSQAYKSKEFKEVNESFIKYDLFQINNLIFYQRTL